MAEEKPGAFAQRNRWRVIWNEWLGRPECPYLQRWALETPQGSVRLHHWIKGDDPRAFHDHGWWFWTVVLWGGYTDVSPAGRERMRPFRPRFRPALHRHTVDVDPGGCWTLLLTGPHVRFWGFWVKLKDGSGREAFRKSNRYFIENKHHPCE